MAKAAAVHRTQHLDVADGIETVARRDAFANDLQDLGNPVLGIGTLDEVEIAGRILVDEATGDVLGLRDLCRAAGASCPIRSSKC
jgi:hypothetical protein